MIPTEALQAFATELRSSYRAMIPSAGRGDDVAAIRDFAVPATHPRREIPVRAYVPRAAAEPLPMVLFAHGGCFVSGDFDTHDVLVRALANRARAVVVAVDYRLAPEHPFPAGLEDVYEATKWAVEHASEIGGDARRVGIAGDSAGGNLATATAMLARDRGGPELVAQLLMYPMITGAMDTASWRQLGETQFPTRTVVTHSMAAYARSEADARSPLVEPLLARHEALPPALLQVGELDPLRDECHAYADRLAAAGVDAKAVTYPRSAHGFIQFFKDSRVHISGERALDDAVAFLTEQFRSV